MDKKIYRNNLLQKFKERNGEELNWETYQDQQYTRLLDQANPQISRNNLISLMEDEYPLLECSLPNGNYFLMTTDYVYSYFRRYLAKGAYQNLIGYNRSTFFFRKTRPINKMELYVLEYQNQRLLFFEIDRGFSSYYVEDFFRLILGRNA